MSCKCNSASCDIGFKCQFTCAAFLHFFLLFHQNTSLLTIRICFSFQKLQPKVSPTSAWALHSDLALTAFLWVSLWPLQNLCSSIYGISDKVSFWRNNELPDVTKQSQEHWDFCAFIKLGQIWRSFSTHWLSSHFSRHKQLLEYSKHK